MIKKIALSWMLIASLLLAQKVTQIKFEGLAHLSPSVAKEIAGIHVGDQINNEKINQSIQNFFEQGYFQDIWVDKQGGKLIYHFKEKVAIAHLEIKGYGSGDDGKNLLRSIGLKKGDLYDEARI
jgi:outer membrane protein insertion porin family